MTAAYSEITTSFTSLKNSTMVNSSDGQYFENKHASYMVYVTTFTAVLAIILNCLSMLATLHVPGKLTSHLKYILSLSFSDTLLPLATTSSAIHVAILPDISNNVSKTLHSDCAEMVISIMTNISILATQFILVAMAFDHHVAIDKPLHYKNMCSTGKANFVILLVWSAASTISLTNVIIGIDKFYYKKAPFRNVCHCAQMDDYFVEYIIYGTTIICLIIIMATYGKIFCNVKDLTSGMQEPRQRNWLRNKKALTTTLLIVGSFFLFYLPNCFYQIGLLIQEQIDPLSIKEMFSTLYALSNWLFFMQILNSACDPIIYALRLKEVQCGYNIMKNKLKSLIVHSQDRQYRYSYQSTTSSRSRTGSAISEDREQNHRFSLTNSQCIAMESSNTKNTTRKQTMLCNYGDAELGVIDVVPDATSIYNDKHQA